MQAQGSRRAHKGVWVGTETSAEGLGAGTGGGDLTEQLLTFPAGSPINFACGKAAGKVTNHDHVTGDMATIISSRQLPSIQIGIT